MIFILCLVFVFALTVLNKTYTAAAMATHGILLKTIASVRCLVYFKNTHDILCQITILKM